MVIFHSFLYVYQRIYTVRWGFLDQLIRGDPKPVGRLPSKTLPKSPNKEHVAWWCVGNIGCKQSGIWSSQYFTIHNHDVTEQCSVDFLAPMFWSPGFSTLNWCPTWQPSNNLLHITPWLRQLHLVAAGKHLQWSNVAENLPSQSDDWIIRVRKFTGWWCNNHLEKWWSSSMGRMTSHIWNGTLKMFETTNQFIKLATVPACDYIHLRRGRSHTVLDISHD